MHISNILKERELYEDSVVKEFLTTAGRRRGHPHAGRPGEKHYREQTERKRIVVATILTAT